MEVEPFRPIKRKADSPLGTPGGPGKVKKPSMEFLQSENMFNSLSSEEEAPSAAATTSKSAKSTPAEVKGPKVPPIAIFNINIRELAPKIQSVVSDKSHIRIKLTQFGTKVFLSTIDEYKALRKYCTDNSIQFYTHPLPEERKTKFVLYGLPADCDKALIAAALALHKLAPVEIKPLNIKNKRYDAHGDFVVYFMEKDRVSLEQLNLIKAIDHMVVKFRRFSKREWGPTQCSRCLTYGHGKDNCNLPVRCVRCGKRHASNSCEFLIKPGDVKSKIPADKVSCANCNGQHTANFKGCPSRKAFIDLQQQMRSDRVRRQKPRQVNFSIGSSSYGAHYPSLAPRVHRDPPMLQQPPSTSYRDIVIDQPAEALFTTEQCFSIFENFMSKLSSCRTKAQQIRAIAELVFSNLSQNESR